MSIDEATRIFLTECLKDEKIINELKKHMFGAEDCGYEENQYAENKSENEKIMLVDEYQNIASLFMEQREFIKNTGEMIIKNVEDCLNKLNVDIANDQMNNKMFYNQNIALKKQLTELQKNYEQIQNENENIKNKYLLVNRYADMWSMLEQLDEDTKEYLCKLCGNFNLDACISLGREENKIEQLFEYIKGRIMKTNSRDEVLDILNEYLDFCISIANSVSDEAEQFYYDNVEIGSEVDTEKCIRSSDSNTFGYVREVFTKCIMKEGHVVFKAIVKVK